MSSDFVDYVNELLAPLGSVRSKRMFGGVGIYINDYFCALIADDCLYFKGDDENEAEFAASKCPPFTYEKGGIVHAMRYYRAPRRGNGQPHGNGPLGQTRIGRCHAKGGCAKAEVKKNTARNKSEIASDTTRLAKMEIRIS